MRSNNEAIIRNCTLCQHARIRMDESLPPLLSAIQNGGTDSDLLSCPYHKELPEKLCCGRFRFDPSKYRPKKSKSPILPDEGCLLLDESE